MPFNFSLCVKALDDEVESPPQGRGEVSLYTYERSPVVLAPIYPRTRAKIQRVVSKGMNTDKTTDGARGWGESPIPPAKRPSNRASADTLKTENRNMNT